MPYTPPSHTSPASSASASPDASRRSSFNSSSTPTRPPLPRSASYLTRHRRTASAVAVSAAPSSNHGSTPDITPPGTSDDLKGMAIAHSSAIRQSPPPVANARAIPPGAIISPPESSSEDEGIAGSDRGREREITSMEALKEAISAIPQVRASSPNRTSPGDLLLLPSQFNELVQGPLAKPTIRTDGLDIGRKISHTRSHTDSHIYLGTPAETILSASDEGSEQDELFKKPQMVRKKSGELVRPALRPLRRPSSMPGTPTFSKAVHFDSHLEHVRHFLQVDRPLAVSAGSSPADNYDSDVEYPFKPAAKPEPLYEWEIVVNNFPAETPLRKGLAVRLERVWMSPDQKSLIGSVAVANMAFQKSVVCRFTFDYWKTTSEIGAEYHHEIRPKYGETGHDRFQFIIKLSDIANLESKTLFFCIRYNVNGQEYWDNNDYVNFQVDFRKKLVPQNGKRGASSRPANALPRSNRRANPSSAARPRSMPVGALDEFGHDSKLAARQPIHEFLGEPEPIGLRLKSSKSTTSLPSDNLSSRLSTPSGVAFANRYDFGASLSAAMQAQKNLKSSPRQNDGLYMKAHQRGTLHQPEREERHQSQSTGVREAAPAAQQPGSTSPMDGPRSAQGTTTSIASASYEEILNKYCFFNGSKQSSPQLKDGTLRSGRYDGADESPAGSPSTAVRASHTLHRTVDYHSHGNYIAIVGPAVVEPPSGSAPGPGRLSVSSGIALPTGNIVVEANNPPNPSISERPPYHHAQRLRELSPFSKDSHTTPAISC